MRKIIAFYAWQSDTPEQFNRQFMQIALEDAAKRITQDSALDVELVIDYDTAGVPGTPPISDTILKKIDGCDIFIPDVFVARTERGKLLPNPNVMMEYGYALRAKTYTAMMPVMNTAFGPPEELPFDMGHLRHPIQYHAETTATDAERRRLRQGLSQQFEAKLRLQIAATQPAPPLPVPFPEVTPSYNHAVYFEPNEVLATGNSGQAEYRFSYEKAVYIRFFPTHGNRRIGLAALNPIFETQRPVPLCVVQGGIVGRNRFGPIIYAPQGPDKIDGLTQGFETGELWGIDGTIFRPDEHWDYRLRYQGIPMIVIPIIDFEKLYIRVLRNYVHRDALSDTTDDAIKAVLGAYFADLYDLAAFARKDVFTTGVVAAHDLPSL
ncbi:MAG TPA: hypothetical protein VNZ53_49055 [Steroidobacteraceae bacterium]|nr:hypothetical protein [Steroidobacteraceae bacterium]